MKKRADLLAIFLMVMLTGLISAAAFSFSDALSSIEGKTLVVLLVFVISFALLFFALSRAFRGNVSVAAVISFALSFGITYLINRSDFDLGMWIYDIGISTEILSVLIPVLVAGAAIFLILRFKRDSLFIFGGLFLASALFVYEKAIMIVIGAVLILVRLLWKKRSEKDKDWYEKKYWKNLWRDYEKKKKKKH